MTQLAPSTRVGIPLQRSMRHVWACRPYCTPPLATSLSSSSEGDIAFDGTVQDAKARLDFWLASQLPSHISRARVQSSIRSGLAFVNGQPVDKVSYSVRNGDHVRCAISALTPLKAEPEEICLDIVFEDNHVLVVNKPAQMVTHPAPGNWTGTLVNALVHHCELPVACESTNESSADEFEEDIFNDDEPFGQFQNLNSSVHKGVPLAVRPGFGA